jgi:hypothetical protein
LQSKIDRLSRSWDWCHESNAAPPASTVMALRVR